MELLSWIEEILALAGSVVTLHALLRLRTRSLPQRFAVLSELAGGLFLILSAAFFAKTEGVWGPLSIALAGLFFAANGVLGTWTVLLASRSTAAQTETEGERLHEFLANSDDPDALAPREAPED